MCQMQEDGSASGAFILSNPVTPALQAFPRVTNTYGSYQVTQTQQRTCSQWSRGGTGNRLFLYLLCIRMPTSHSLGPLARVSAALVVWFTSPGPSPCTALPRPLSPLPGKNTFIIMVPSQKVVFKLRGWYFRLSLSELKLPCHLCDSTAQAQVLHTGPCVPPA